MTDHIYVPSTGPADPKLFILGESPSTEEIKLLKPFVGPSGQELDKILKDAGIYRHNCWISNVCKYYVPEAVGPKKIPFQVRAKNHGIDMEKCLEELQVEINDVNPNCILGLGGTALWAMTGKNKITNYRGSIMFGRGKKTICTYHPAHLLHRSAQPEMKGYWNRYVMVNDFRRAWEQAQFPELNLPQRKLSICQSSYQLSEFRARYKNHTRPAVDIEARGKCIPACIGIAFTPDEGLTVPLWNTGEYKEIINISDSDMISMWIILAEILAEHDVVGQYFSYDRDKISRLGFIVKSIASDLMMKAMALDPEFPKRLSFNTSLYTLEPFYKDEGMYEGSLYDLFIGCARDACVTKEVDLAMDPFLDEIGQRDFYENFLMKLPEFYSDIEKEGFTIDYKTRDFLYDKYVRWSEQLNYELFCIAGTEINVNSPKQVYSYLFDTLGLPRRSGTGEEELTSLLNNEGRTGVQNKVYRRAIEIILEKRRVDKSIGNYLSAIPDYDGRMKTTYFPCLETGRSATGQLDPPIRPTIEVIGGDGKPKKKSIGTAFQTMTKHGDIGEDVRSQYVARNGYIFSQADAAQAETRVVFRLANDEQALKDIDEHDYHALTASWFFGGVEDDYSKRKLGFESPIRFAGKTLRHAGHLGAGKRRAATELNTQARKYKIPITINEFIAERSLKIFHMKQPKIQQVFQNDVKNEITRTRVLIAPIPYGVNSKVGGRRTFYERYGEELFRQAFSYLPQRAISDNTKNAGMRLKKREPTAFKEGIISIILEAHDALLFHIRETELDYFAPMIKEEMERPIRFDTCSLPRPDLIVPCELETGYNYQELKKFKFNVPIKQSEIEKPIEPTMIPITPFESFGVVNIPKDSHLDELIYEHQEMKKEFLR